MIQHVCRMRHTYISSKLTFVCYFCTFVIVDPPVMLLQFPINHTKKFHTFNYWGVSCVYHRCNKGVIPFNRELWIIIVTRLQVIQNLTSRIYITNEMPGNLKRALEKQLILCHCVKILLWIHEGRFRKKKGIHHLDVHLTSEQRYTSYYYVSDLQSLIVLSFANAPDAIMFSVGWQAVHRTTSASITIQDVDYKHRKETKYKYTIILGQNCTMLDHTSQKFIVEIVSWFTYKTPQHMVMQLLVSILWTKL